MAKNKSIDIRVATKKDLDQATGVIIDGGKGPPTIYPFAGERSATQFLKALKSKGYEFYAASGSALDFPLQIPTNQGIPTDPIAEADLAWQYYASIGMVGVAVDTISFLTTKVPRVRGLRSQDEIKINAWLDKSWRARGWINNLDIALRNTGSIVCAYVDKFIKKSIIDRRIINGVIQENFVDLNVPRRITMLNYQSVNLEKGPADSPDIRVRLPIETVRAIQNVARGMATNEEKLLVESLDERIVKQVNDGNRLITIPSDKSLLYRRGIVGFQRYGRVWTSRAFLHVQELIDAIKQMWVSRRNLLRGLIFAKVQRPGSVTPPKILKAAIQMLQNPVNVNGNPVIVWDESLSFERISSSERVDIMGTEFDRIIGMIVDALEMAPLFRARNREVPRLFESMSYVSLTQEMERDIISRGTKPLLEAVADANNMKGDPYLDWDDDPRTTDPAQLRSWVNLLFRFGIIPPLEVAEKAGLDPEQILISRIKSIEEGHNEIFTPPTLPSGGGSFGRPAPTPEGGRPPGDDGRPQ